MWSILNKIVNINNTFMTKEIYHFLFPKIVIIFFSFTYISRILLALEVGIMLASTGDQFHLRACRAEYFRIMSSLYYIKVSLT